MDHGMGDNSGSNGILMEDEIFEIPPEPAQPQTVQPQFESAAQPQTTEPQQYRNLESSHHADEFAAFNDAPSFDAMDGMGMNAGAAGGGSAFTGGNAAPLPGWENQYSDTVFRGSDAGRMAGANQAVIYEKPSSNLLLGLVGAVVGALIGAVLWVIIYQMGYIAGIAGAAIIGFSIKGYVLLGKAIDVKGIILCAVLCIVTIYFAHRVSFAISYMVAMNKSLDTHMSFTTAYTNMDQFMKTMDATAKALGTSSRITVAYWRDLVVGYVLSAVVGIPMAIKMVAHS